MKDLTKGKPSRLILAFALPIFLANTAWWIPGLSDRFWGKMHLQLSVLQVH
mgnify:CR=1 FL=1